MTKSFAKVDMDMISIPTVGIEKRTTKRGARTMKKKAEEQVVEVKQEVEQVKPQRTRKEHSKEEQMVNAIVKQFHKNVWTMKKAMKNSQNAEEFIKQFGVAVSKMNNEICQIVSQLELEVKISALTAEQKEYLKKMLNA